MDLLCALSVRRFRKLSTRVEVDEPVRDCEQLVLFVLAVTRHQVNLEVQVAEHGRRHLVLLQVPQGALDQAKYVERVFVIVAHQDAHGPEGLEKGPV